MTTPAPAPATAERVDVAPRRRGRARAGGAGSIVLIVFLAAAYFVPRGPTWNADTRIFLTASIVDRGSLNIDPFATYTGDLASYQGHYYTDKAPGLSLLAVPVYALLKYTLLGGKPYSALFAVPAASRIDFVPRYLLALVFAALPTGLLCALLLAMLARLGVPDGWRTLLALTYGLGTIAFSFADELFGHQLAALFVFGAFFVLYRVRQRELTARAAVAAGVLAGLAIITEYPTVLLIGGLALYLLSSAADRRQRLLWFAGGIAPLLAVGGVYNTLAFGGPLSQGYAHLAGPQVFRQGQAQGLMGITYPHLDALWQTTFGPYRGIFLLSPILLLAIPGFVYLARRTAWRAEWALWLGSALVYFLFTISYFEWDGGFSIGPRQYLPALPFLVLPIGELVRRERSRAWRVAVAWLSGVSIAIVVLATSTGPLFDPSFDAPLTQYALPSLFGLSPDPAHPQAAWTRLVAMGPRALTGLFSAHLDNNWGMPFGLPGIVQLVPLACMVGAVLGWRVWRGRRWAGTLRARATVADAALALTTPRLDGDDERGIVSGSGLGGREGRSTVTTPGTVTVRQAPGALAAAGIASVAAAASSETIPLPWEQTILDAVRQRGDEPSAGVLRALGAIKTTLLLSRELAVFKQLRTILLYGPLAHGDDPLLEVNLLVVCNAIKGPFGVERAFAEIDGLSRRVLDETGVRLRPLIVVRGQPERGVPGEPSWRELARRGIVVYGADI